MRLQTPLNAAFISEQVLLSEFVRKKYTIFSVMQLIRDQTQKQV
jgi:hypothetical protein